MVLGVVKGGVRVCQGGSQESGDATNKTYVAVLHRPLTIQPWTFRVDWLGRQKTRDGVVEAAAGGERKGGGGYLRGGESDDPTIKTGGECQDTS